MLGSMHAIQFNHLRHHKYFPDKTKDIEALSVGMTAFGAISIGPIFPFLLHRKALEEGNATQLTWIYLELLVNVALIFSIFMLIDNVWLQYHVIVMCIGHCLTAFFAVWTFHHDCDSLEGASRTIRNRFKAVLTYNMFYHLEHHLFPAVPTCHLHMLPNRLDEAMPKISKKYVF